MVGKPDAVRTEIVKAFIVLKSGHAPSDALAAEIQAFVQARGCRRTNIRARSPSSTQMPMTTTGKVIRRLLREQA